MLRKLLKHAEKEKRGEGKKEEESRGDNKKVDSSSGAWNGCSTLFLFPDSEQTAITPWRLWEINAPRLHEDL